MTRHSAFVIKGNATDVCVPTVVIPGDFDGVVSLVRALLCVQVEREADRAAFKSYDFFRHLHKFKLRTWRQKNKPVKLEHCSIQTVKKDPILPFDSCL